MVLSLIVRMQNHRLRTLHTRRICSNLSWSVMNSRFHQKSGIEITIFMHLAHTKNHSATQKVRTEHKHELSTKYELSTSSRVVFEGVHQTATDNLRVLWVAALRAAVLKECVVPPQAV